MKVGSIVVDKQTGERFIVIEHDKKRNIWYIQDAIGENEE